MDKPHIDDLPREVLLRVFCFLVEDDLSHLCQAVRRTCTRWRHLTLDYILWRHVVPPAHLSAARLLLLLRPVQSHVEVLDLSDSLHLRPHCLADLCQLTLTRLRTLRLRSDWDVSPRVLLRLLSAQPSLERLQNCPVSNKHTLTAGECQRLFPRLHSVVDHSATVHDYNTKQQYWGEALLSPQYHTACANIREYSCVSTDYRYVQSGVLRLLLTALPRLHALTLCLPLLEEPLLHGYFSCHSNKHLRRLTIRTHEPVSARCLRAIAACCPSLTDFIVQSDDLAGVSSGEVEYFARQCRFLSVFILAPLKPEHGALGLSSVFDSDGGLSRLSAACPGLSNLSVSHTSRLTAAGLESVAAQCRRLTCLTLASCGRLGDGALEALLQCPGLARLMLWDMVSITAPAVTHFMQRAPALTTLCFKYDFSAHPQDSAVATCHTSSCVKHLHFEGNNATFLQLAGVCPRLSTAEQLCQATPLTASELEALLTTCPALRILHAPATSSQALKVLARRGSHLQKIRLPHCDADSLKRLTKVVKSLPSLSVLHVSNIHSRKITDKVAAAARKSHNGKCFVNSQKAGKTTGHSFYFTPIKYLK